MNDGIVGFYIMIVIFSFFTVLILLNVLIGKLDLWNSFTVMVFCVANVDVDCLWAKV